MLNKTKARIRRNSYQGKKGSGAEKGDNQNPYPWLLTQFDRGVTNVLGLIESRFDLGIGSVVDKKLRFSLMGINESKITLYLLGKTRFSWAVFCLENHGSAGLMI